MFCETCGKKLIRGYSFCVDCGTPVPPGAFDEDDTPPVEELKPGMGTEDSMPGIQPKHASVEGGSLSSGSGVPLFNTDNTGFGGLGMGGDPDQAVVNLFGAPSAPSGISAIGGFNSSSSNIDMPSIEAPAKTSQAKQKEPEKGQERLMNDFSMTAAAADETLEMTDRAVTVLGSASMDENVGADIDLSPYKFLDNKIEIGEPTPEASEPEPVAVAVEEPKPVEVAPIEPTPVAVAVEEPKPVEPEPVVVAVEEPKPVEVAPIETTPVAVAVEEPKAPETTPVAVAVEEPKAPEPEPVAVAVEEPKVPETTPVAAAVEEPKPVEVAPIEPTPVAVAVEESKPAEPEPAAVAPVEPAPVAVEEPKTPAPADDIDDFIPEEMSVIEESSPFVEDIPLLSPSPKADSPKTDSVKSEPVKTAAAETPAKTEAPAKPESMPELLRPASPKTTAPTAPTTPTAPNAPTAPTAPKSPNAAPAASPQKGKLVYCRNCGQDMYDTEKVCKNCGAPYKGAYVPPKQQKQPKKLFGFLPLSAVIGMASVVVVMTALIIFLATRGDNNSVPVVSGSDVNIEPGSTSVVVSSSAAPIKSSVVSSQETPVESSTGEVSSTVESTSTEQQSSIQTQQTPASVNPPVEPPVHSTPVVVTPQPSDTMTRTAAIQEFDRKKLADAAAVILGETGKIHTYSQSVIRQIKAGGSVSSELKSNLLKSIDQGNNNVKAAMGKVISVNSALSPCKNALNTVKSKYDDYYNYVKKNDKLNELTCLNYYNAVEQALNNVRANQYSSDYNSNDKELAKKSMNTTAVDIINSTYSKMYNLRGLFDNTSLNYENSAYNALASNAAPFMEVASNAYKVKAYSILMNDDAIIRSNFNDLNKRLDVYVNIDKYIGKYDEFYNSVY